MCALIDPWTLLCDTPCHQDKHALRVCHGVAFTLHVSGILFPLQTSSVCVYEHDFLLFSGGRFCSRSWRFLVGWRVCVGHAVF